MTLDEIPTGETLIKACLKNINYTENGYMKATYLIEKLIDHRAHEGTAAKVQIIDGHLYIVYLNKEALEKAADSDYHAAYRPPYLKGLRLI